MAKKKSKRQNNIKKNLQKSSESLNGARVNKNRDNYNNQKLKKFDLDTLDEILEETEKLDLTNISELKEIDNPKFDKTGEVDLDEDFGIDEFVPEDSEKEEEAEDNEKEEDLDLTNVSELTFDEIRLMDSDSLDTSFLEGRSKKKRRSDKILKEEPVKSRSEKNKDISKNYTPKKSHKGVIRFVSVIILALIVGFCICLFCFNKIFVKTKVVKAVEEKEVVKLDENILFLGDSITDQYDLDKYYSDYNVVNSGISGNTTETILKNMNERVYRYNPSKIFLLIGTNDYIFDGDNDSIVKNVEEIIKGIKENRPYAEIYLESIYPVNDTDDDKIDHDMVNNRKNSDIRKANEELKELASTLKITYIDMYSLLEDDEENLKLDYTKEGLHINDEGYKVITKELLKYIKK